MAAAGLREELNCSLCWEIYTNPVTLPCGHNYCLRCIGRLFKQLSNIKEDLFCPECRQRYGKQPELNINVALCNIAERFHPTHPKSGREQIPCTYCDSPVPAAKSCLLCEASLCARHVRVHSKAAEHVLTLPTVLIGHRNCSAHQELLRYRCTEDGAHVCVSCCLAGEHRGHGVELLNESPERIFIQAVAAADLKADLTCPVCQEFYTDPVTLPCGHNICRVCIGGTWDWQKGIEGDLTCPECRERYWRHPELNRNLRLHNIVQSFLPTHPGQEGALCTYCAPPVPAAKSCLSCEASLCDIHVRMHGRSAQHQLIDSSTLFRDNNCPTHQKPLGYYCREDAACICEYCVPEHGGHRVEKLDGGTEKIKEKLRILQVMQHSDLRDKLSCPLCQKIYTDPVTLPCGHNYCRVCIGRHWDWQEGIKEHLTCPECKYRYWGRLRLNWNRMLRNIVQRLILTLPELCGPTDFCTYCIHSIVPSAIPATKSCLHCAASLCAGHVTEHSQSAEHVLTAPTRRCPAHQELLRYRCTEDGAPVCVSCCLAGGHRGHRGHKVELLDEASEIRPNQGTVAAGLRDKLSCPLCQLIYTDPVTLPCGHNYCLRCIGRHWDWQKGIKEDPSCPECRHPCIREKKQRMNNTLCNIVRLLLPPPEQRDPAGTYCTYCTYCIYSLVPAAKSCLLCKAFLCDKHVRVHSQAAEHVLSEPPASFGYRRCSAHQELLRYRCTEDGAQVCVSCCLAGEHWGHRVEMFP